MGSMKKRIIAYFIRVIANLFESKATKQNAKTDWEKHLIKIAFRDKYKLKCIIEQTVSLGSEFDVETVPLSYFEDVDFIDYINQNYLVLHLVWNYYDNSFIFTAHDSELPYVYIYTGDDGRINKVICSGFKKFHLSKFEKYYNEQEEIN